MNEYGVFAAYYDSLTQDVNYKERAEYFRTLLCNSGVSEGALLDLACGTGSLLYEMAALGFDTIGVDSSADMLAVARNKPEYDKYSPLLLLQEMQKLDLYGSVDCVLSGLDSINHLTDKADVAETFRRVFTFLNPGGVFIFDVNTPYKHEHILADNSFVFELDKLFCVWQNYYDKQSESVEICLDFFTEQTDGSYFRESQLIVEKTYKLDELKSVLESVGFRLLAIHEDMTFKAVRDKSQRAVFVAKKPV